LSPRSNDLTAAELRAEVIRLGPWHIDVEITPEVSTRAFLEAPPGTYPESQGSVTFHDPHDGFLRRLGRAFPNGLEGRSVLDCACNCGAYLFFAKEAGAGRCVGFDVREHWIEQARFLAEHRRRPADDMRFEVCDLYDLGKLGAGRFDVTFFFGIFYHLPDPVTGLKQAADLTDELLIVNTATMAGHRDGLLVAGRESETKLMSGAYGLCWYPTGPLVLTRILNWLGFPEVRCSVWRHAPRQRQELDRVEVLAARTPGFFSDWDEAVPDGDRIASLLATRTAPGATTLVLGDGGGLGDVPDRRLVPLAARSTGELTAEVEGRRRDGARYVAVVDEDPAARQGRAAMLGEPGTIVFDEAGLRLYELDLEDVKDEPGALSEG
jgi:SAM-dependent methyltransferase